jgi:uncharacterized protein (DUF1810 family)
VKASGLAAKSEKEYMKKSDKDTENSGLERFLDAQQRNYEIALSEVRGGSKRSHWMWYIFPQISGLGLSEMSRRFALKNIAEAREFLRHPVLGKRLIEISGALLQLRSNDAKAIFGTPDDLKLRSSMTLFALLEDTDPVFDSVLMKFFDREKDVRTIGIIAQDR